MSDNKQNIEETAEQGGQVDAIVSQQLLDIPDYDSGVLNDYGGGNTQWWQDYIRVEINRCNEYWSEQIRNVL